MTKTRIKSVRRNAAGDLVVGLTKKSKIKYVRWNAAGDLIVGVAKPKTS